MINELRMMKVVIHNPVYLPAGFPSGTTLVVKEGRQGVEYYYFK